MVDALDPGESCGEATVVVVGFLDRSQQILDRPVGRWGDGPEEGTDGGVRRAGLRVEQMPAEIPVHQISSHRSRT
jgi:hypothetical protein